MNDMLLKLYVKFQELKNREEGQDLVEYFRRHCRHDLFGHRHQYRVQQCQLAAGHRNQLVSVLIQPGQAQPVRCNRGGRGAKEEPNAHSPLHRLIREQTLESQLPAITFVRSLPD
jgi:hypothetical protein